MKSRKQPAKKGPFFSIVIPVYNKKGYLHRSIGSVLKQSFGDFELIVVDDGSKDGSPAAIRSLKDRRVHLIRQENAGVSAARNRGVAAVRGKYVTFLDADDEWDLDYLASIKGLIEEFPGAGLYAANYSIDNGQRKTSNPVALSPGWRGRMRDYYGLCRYNQFPFCTNTVCLPAALAKSIPFPLGIKAGEDLLVWFKASLEHDTVYWNKPLSTWYITVTDNAHATYFGPQYHLDWLAVGDEVRKAGLLPPSAQKYIVWATLVQIRKMIAKGYRVQALEKWWRCPKYYFPFYQAVLLAVMGLPTGVPKKLLGLFSRRKKVGS